ncbi:MAG: hypothetical protein M3Z54_01675 [Gemmatimonadota bacterium]|nr:hypothetical protein [Gemmatimonadota bacterium]
MNAAHRHLVHSVDEILNAGRQALQEKEGKSRVNSHRPRYGGVGEEQAPCRFSRDRGRWIDPAGEKRNLAERGSRFTGVDDELSAASPADDSNLSLEDESDSLRSIAG